MLFQLHYYVVALLVSLIKASIVKGLAIESTRCYNYQKHASLRLNSM